MSTLPRHIAIIMDGNGRWATAQGLTRTEGHKKGAEAARRAVEAARDLGIEYLTLFSFSSENWNRPADEVDTLMGLLQYHLKKEMAELHKHGVRLKVIGERSRLSKDLQVSIARAEEKTKNNSGMTVVVALSYGGRDEIVEAARHMAQQVANGDINAEDITRESFAEALMTQGIPDPDLLIRTSDERRISNFLLWQLAYAEFFFTPTLWPDFDKNDMEEALQWFQGRERRYGGVTKNNKA